MIQIGDMTLDPSDPLVMAAIAGSVALLLILILLIVAVRAAGRSARASEPLAQQLGHFNRP